jgi:hypothetical protein
MLCVSQWVLLSRVHEDDESDERKLNGLDTDISTEEANKVLKAVRKWFQGGMTGPQPYKGVFQYHVLGGNHKTLSIQAAYKVLSHIPDLQYVMCRFFWKIPPIDQKKVGSKMCLCGDSFVHVALSLPLFGCQFKFYCSIMFAARVHPQRHVEEGEYTSGPLENGCRTILCKSHFVTETCC